MKNNPIIQIIKMLCGAAGAVYFLIKAWRTQDDSVGIILLAYVICGIIAYNGFRKLKNE